MPSRQNALPREILNRALSIRQPLSELILLGEETHEFPDRTAARQDAGASRPNGLARRRRLEGRKERIKHSIYLRERT
jgi:hypothetical protein